MKAEDESDSLGWGFDNQLESPLTTCHHLDACRQPG